MSESKILKAKCTKTGQYFGLEIKQVGGTWKVVNMIRLSEEERNIIMSEVRQPVFETNTTLIACERCGNRKVGGCACARKKHPCSLDMKYQFDCIYCDRFQIDYSRTGGRVPYTKWAGTSNIPGAIKDRYGNPQGSEYDLAQDGSFVGYKIVVLNLCRDSSCNFNAPRAALEKKGFSVIERKVVPSPQELQSLLADDKSQLWVLSDRTSFMKPEHIEIVYQYFRSGHGVYVWADNAPYYADANQILGRLFAARMTGDYRGDRVLGIQARDKEPGIIPNHPITTGIVSFYEGITISRLEFLATGLKPLIYASDRSIVTAYYDADQKRALVDGGFTRLYYKWDSAGTDRYVVNAAAWLANIEFFGYYNG